jgi:hypothetical protein
MSPAAIVGGGGGPLQAAARLSSRPRAAVQRTLAPTVLALATLLGMATNAYGASVPITAESPLPWLHITTSSEPGFSALVQAAIGDLDASSLSDVLPYSVVITNGGTEPIVALGLRFKLKTGDKVTHGDGAAVGGGRTGPGGARQQKLLRRFFRARFCS